MFENRTHEYNVKMNLSRECELVQEMMQWPEFPVTSMAISVAKLF
jgi:hypothetical protein